MTTTILDSATVETGTQFTCAAANNLSIVLPGVALCSNNNSVRGRFGAKNLSLNVLASVSRNTLLEFAGQKATTANIIFDSACNDSLDGAQGDETFRLYTLEEGDDIITYFSGSAGNNDHF